MSVARETKGEQIDNYNGITNGDRCFRKSTSCKTNRFLACTLLHKPRLPAHSLGLFLPALDALLRPKVSVSECLCCMLDEWRRGDNCNLNDIIAALDVVGRRALAEELQAKWSDCHC